MQDDCPRPTAVVWATASYVRVPDLETIPTERFFNSTLGTDIRGSLFEFVDYGTATVIEDQIRNTVEFYEDRIENLKIQVDPRPDNNSFDVKVFFDIVGSDFPPQAFSFILEATR